jgi:hypothetical protein
MHSDGVSFNSFVAPCDNPECKAQSGGWVVKTALPQPHAMHHQEQTSLSSAVVMCMSTLKLLRQAQQQLGAARQVHNDNMYAPALAL